MKELERRARVRRAQLARWQRESDAIFARLPKERSTLGLPPALSWELAGKAIVFAAMAAAMAIVLALAVSIRPPESLRRSIASLERQLPVAASCPPSEPLIQPDIPQVHDEPPIAPLPAPRPPRVVQSDAGPPFDRGAAAGALGAVKLASCRSASGPTGSGHAKVTFEPTGKVSLADVDAPPFSGTPTGACIAAKFRAATIPKFTGSSVMVGKSFSL